MVKSEGVRLWVASSGSSPEGWTPVRGPWHALLMLLRFPDVVAISIEDRPEHRVVAWAVTGAHILGELPGSTAPVIEVRR